MTLRFARGVATCIEDMLQLQVGSLGLEESRKPIEQAQISIQEAKRVKLSVFIYLKYVYMLISLNESLYWLSYLCLCPFLRQFSA